MRLHVGAVLAVGAVVAGAMCGACEALSGLNDYSTGPALPDGTVPPGSTEGGGDDAPTTPSDDAPIGVGDDASSSDGEVADSGTDARAWLDGGHHEAAAPCGPSNCSTCCTDAGCASANANSACGTGGGTCTDCAGSGEACSSGACVQTSCVASSCGKCTPYFVQCCKAGTGGCGCSLLFPPGPCT